jgi:cytosine/adenosine deaminase-related metal-dependent hydrolase
MTVLNRATIVVGDGSDRIRDGAVIVAGGRILDVRDESIDETEREFADPTVLDLDGDLLFPGLINSHMHAAISTPLTAAAGPAPSHEEADVTRDRHLLAGATTVVNADAFALPAEVATAREDHPLKVEFAACPTPSVIARHRRSG